VLAIATWDCQRKDWKKKTHTHKLVCKFSSTNNNNDDDIIIGDGILKGISALSAVGASHFIANAVANVMTVAEI
jgi:hypothetical protein